MIGFVDSFFLGKSVLFVSWILVLYLLEISVRVEVFLKLIIMLLNFFRKVGGVRCERFFVIWILFIF